MNLLGITKELEADAARYCAGGFRAWIGEVRRAEWRDAGRMMASFPRCLRLGGDLYHFTLGRDGTGIEADVFFQEELRLVIAHRIAFREMKAAHLAGHEPSPVCIE